MSVSGSRQAYDESTKGMWTAGVATFAGVMLTIVGIFQILEGIAAIGNDSVFVSGVQYAFTFNITAWGWLHLVLGLVGVLVGLAIVAGQTVGYLAGIAIAGLNAIFSFAFLPHYPVWSLIIVGFNVLILWALCSQIAHDRVDIADVEGPA